jgi:hypothetical protein
MTTGIARPRPDAGFVDALTGADGTGEPVVPLPLTERFSDALAAPEADTPRPTGATGPSQPPVAPLPQAAVTARPTGAVARQAQRPAARAGRPAVVVAPAAAPAAAFGYTPTASAQRSVAPQAYLPQAYLPAARPPAQPVMTWPAQPAAHRPAQRPSARPASAPYTPARPAAALHAQPKQTKKSGAGGFVTFLFFVLIALFATGLGRTILDALSNLIHQWTG